MKGNILLRVQGNQVVEHRSAQSLAMHIDNTRQTRGISLHLPSYMRSIPSRLNDQVCNIRLVGRTYHRKAYDQFLVEHYNGRALWPVVEGVAHYLPINLCRTTNSVSEKLTVDAGPE